MSKVVTSKEEDLDALADEMKANKISFKKKGNDMHKWLLERSERIRRCLKLLSEGEQCSLKPPRKWKNGDSA